MMTFSVIELKGEEWKFWKIPITLLSEKKEGKVSKGSRVN